MGKIEISVEILLYAVCNTLSEIAKVDGRVRRIIKDWDIEIQFKVQPDRPSAYLQIEKGRIIFYKLVPLRLKTGGETSNPTVKIIFLSVDDAYNFLLRKSALPILGILIKNIRHPVFLFQTLRLLLFAGEYLRPSVSAGSVKLVPDAIKRGLGG
jgi:hypothetical protein